MCVCRPVSGHVTRGFHRTVQYEHVKILCAGESSVSRLFLQCIENCKNKNYINTLFIPQEIIVTKSVQTETHTHSSTRQPEVIQTARSTRTPAAGDSSSTNRLLATGSRPVRDHSDQNRCLIQTVKFLSLNMWELTDETPADLYSEGVTGNTG